MPNIHSPMGAAQHARAKETTPQKTSSFPDHHFPAPKRNVSKEQPSKTISIRSNPHKCWRQDESLVTTSHRHRNH